MGGGPDKEDLLVTVPLPRSAFNLAKLQKRYPDFKVTFIQINRDDLSDEQRKSELKALYKKATILLTLHLLPDDPGDIPNLKLIHLLSAGVDHVVSSPIFTSTTIPLTTSSGIHGPPIAEWVLASVLGLSRHSFTMHKWQRDHHWGGTSELPGGMGSMSDWLGKTVGIAGYGSIGRQIARVFTALGCRIHAYTASPRNTPEARRDTGYLLPGVGDPEGTLPAAWYSGTTPESLHTFLRSGLSLLIIALPLTPATTGLFGAEEFQILHDAAPGGGKAAKTILVNIARGKIVDTEAMLMALDGGMLRGAALDVTEPEPLPEGSELWDREDVVVTPHMSALGVEYMVRAFDVFVSNIDRLEKGERLVNEVKRGRGY